MLFCLGGVTNCRAVDLIFFFFFKPVFCTAETVNIFTASYWLLLAQFLTLTTLFKYIFELSVSLEHRFSTPSLSLVPVA